MKPNAESRRVNYPPKEDVTEGKQKKAEQPEGRQLN